MLLPRFTLRTSLVWLSGCALVFLIAAQALAGQFWATAITLAIICMLATLLVHVAFFGLALGIAKIVGGGATPARTRRGGLQYGPDEQVIP